MGVVKFRFLASLLVCNLAVLLAGNLGPRCDFCGKERGWPVAYYKEASLVGDAHYLWQGVLTDLAADLVAAMALTLLWCFLAQRLRRPADGSTALASRYRRRVR